MQRLTHNILEPLEGRRLLAASLANGVLSVTGTLWGDTIVLSPDGAGGVDVRINSTTTNHSGTIDRIAIWAYDGDDRVRIDPGLDIPARIDCGYGHDTATGGDGDDVLSGYQGNDVLDGGAGNDWFYGGNGADQMTGGDGFDTADYTGRTANLWIVLDGFANDGESGERDNVRDSVENVTGGNGDDWISASVQPGATAVDNYFAGSWGNDSLEGGGGNDVLRGGQGADRLRGGTGDDSLRGGDIVSPIDGDDVLDGGAGADFMEGGPGNDTVDYSARTENLNVSLDGVANDGRAGAGIISINHLTGQVVWDLGERDNVQADVETVLGGSGNDRISALATSSVANRFVGNGGNDILDGGGGTDVLEGNAGDDIFFARDVMPDVLYGGTGNDRARVDAGMDGQDSIESTFEFILFPI